ncbi:MAG: tetratricopeptide repeat protein [Alphaproteobacteria bacterium]|nr:MAG: tetratricopeptide repeat protein [Alphaproteobacteria bacterium]
MRLTPITISAAIVLGTMASAGQGQKPDDQIDARSVAMTQQAEALTASARYQEAIDTLESALAVDPRNRAAFVGLARVAQAQKLPGKALKFYAEALKLEPNDVTALAGQGEALVQRGAVDRAKANLAKVRSLCGAACPQASALSAAIAKGPPVDVQTAQVTPPAAANDKN